MLIVGFLSLHPCPLCGEIHGVRIHGYFVRKVREAESKENVGIIIFAIYCGIARERGDQYTKRVLPPFVIPECTIMLSGVMAYLAQNPQRKINYAKAEMTLGAEDPRTIRKHIVGGREIVETTTMELTRMLSRQWGFARVPELKPGTGESERLGETVEEVEAAGKRMHGEVGERTRGIVYVHLVYAVHRARNPLKVPLGRVLFGLAFDDTS